MEAKHNLVMSEVQEMGYGGSGTFNVNTATKALCKILSNLVAAFWDNTQACLLVTYSIEQVSQLITCIQQLQKLKDNMQIM